MATFTTPDTTDYAAIYNASAPADAGGGGDLVAQLARLGLTPADLAGASDAVLRALASQLAGSTPSAAGGASQLAGSTPSAAGGASAGGGAAPGAPSAESLAALGMTPDQIAQLLAVLSAPAANVTVPAWQGLQPGQTDSGGRLVVGPNDVVAGPNETVQWTPATARAWWDNWFANPFPLTGINPQALPGALVLTPDEIARARIINARFGEDPALAQGQNSGFRPGDTSLNNSYDVLAYLKDLLAQKAAGTYRMVNDPSQTSGTSPLAAAELDRNIAAAQATIEQNKQVYDIRKQQQASAGGPFPTPADQPSSGAATGTGTSAAAQARIDAIPKLEGYIKELSSVKAPNAEQAAELTAYQQRLKEYKKTAAAPPVTAAPPPVTTNTPPPTTTSAAASAAPVVGSGSPPPTTTSVSGAAPKVDYSAAITKLNQYISNLSAVKQPTSTQAAELATYRARLADYQSR